MRAFARLLSIPIALVALACGTEPNRVQRTFSQIQVPLFAAASDTIRIQFQVVANPCATGLVIESARMPTSMRFSASTDAGPAVVCPLDATAPTALSIPYTYYYVVTPYHSMPFTVSFAQPGRADQDFIVAAP